MKKKKLISCLLTAAVLGINPMAYAVITLGPLHDTWYEIQIKQTLPNAIDTSGGNGFWKTVKNLKIDTGKQNCYSHVTSSGTPNYFVDTYCNGTIASVQAWEHDSRIVFQDFDISDGSVGSSSINVLTMPILGRSLFHAGDGWIFFYGTVILRPKLDKSGNLKSVTTLTSKQGAIHYEDFVNNIVGEDRSKMKFKFINTSKVQLPAELTDCAFSYESGAHSIPNC